MKITVDMKFKKGDTVWGYCRSRDGDDTEWLVFMDKVDWVQFDDNDCTKLLYGLNGCCDTMGADELFKTPYEACTALCEAIKNTNVAEDKQNAR